MFSDDLEQFIRHGQEEVNIEYKGLFNWTDRQAQGKIIRAMIALSNIQNGGVLIVGVSERDGKVTEYSGLTEEAQKSFVYDHMCRKINKHASPRINFDLHIGKLKIEDKVKKFVVIQVAESTSFTVCTKKFILNKGEQELSANVILRENAIYIRSGSPIESREISGVEEWQNFMDRQVNKEIDKVLKKIPWESIKCSGLADIPIIQTSDIDSYDLEANNVLKLL